MGRRRRRDKGRGRGKEGAKQSLRSQDRCRVCITFRTTHPHTVHIAVVVRHGVVVRRTLDVVLVAEAVVGASCRSTKLLLLSTTAKQENEGAQQTQTQVVQSEADSVVTQAVQHVRRRRPPGSMPSRQRVDQRAGRPRAGQTRPAVAAPPSGSAQSWKKKRATPHKAPGMRTQQGNKDEQQTIHHPKTNPIRKHVHSRTTHTQPRMNEATTHAMVCTNQLRTKQLGTHILRHTQGKRVMSRQRV